MNKKLSFAVENITPVEDSNLDSSQFALLRVDAFATGPSLHDTFTTEENLRKNAPTLFQKPFVFFYDKRMDDAGGHDEGEIAAGFVPHNSQLEIRTLDDGRRMLSCDVLVWKRYSGELLRFFKRDGGRKGVSVEIEIMESREDPKSGLLELITYSFNAITCLGDLIRPAIPSAEAVLQFSKEFEEAKQEFEEKFSDKYSDLDFSIPKSVRRSATKSLEIRKEKGRGGTAESLGIARHLSRNEKTNADKVRIISKFFSRKNVYDDLVIGLYGGRSAKQWSFNLMEGIDAIDSARVSYFTEESSPNEDDHPSEKEEFDMAKRKKDETQVEEQETENLEMAAPEEEQDQPAEDKKEEMAAEPPAEPSEEDKKEEEMAAPSEEDKKDEEEPDGDEDDFSFGFSVEEAMGMMPEDEKCSAEFAKGKEANFSVIANSLFTACHAAKEMCNKMAEDCKVHMAELESLRQFKADREKEQQKFSVDLTLKEASERYVISEDDLNKMREEGYNFEFSRLNEWEQSVKAKCFDFAVIGKKEKDDVVRIALPHTNMWGGSRTQENLWVK